MKAYARIQLSKTHLFIRFERVGNPSRFNLVKDSFLQAFPLAIWDESRHAWCLPIAQLHFVKWWCDQVFGENCAFIRQDTTNSVKIQQQIFTDA